MSGEYVRSATSRQERDTSGECWRCANKDKRIAELEAQVAALTEATRHFLETISLAQRNVTAEHDALNALAALIQEKGDG
jgi:hypothetical protein